MSSPADWFQSLPVVTRYYLSGALLSTVATQLGIVSVELIYLDLNRVFGGLELWRLLTNLLFFGGFGMPFVFNMFFLIRYSQGLEQARFQGRSADYVWCLATCAVVLTIVSAILGGFPFLAPALLSAIVYLWARISPTQPLSIFGLFTVQAFYFPWVLVMITVLMGGSPIPNLLGILAGHVYYFLVDVQGIPLRAPQFLRELLDDVPVPAATQNRGAFGGYNWGGGQRLGG